jgi:hypothetical protein
MFMAGECGAFQQCGVVSLIPLLRDCDLKSFFVFAIAESAILRTLMILCENVSTISYAQDIPVARFAW